MKTKEEILKENGIYAGFRSSYTYDEILKSMEEYAKEYAIEQLEEIKLSIDDNELFVVNEHIKKLSNQIKL